MSKKKTYTFSENRQAQGGITSTVLGILSLLILLVWYEKGNGGLYLGSFGFTSAVLSVCGLVTGLLSFRDKHLLHSFSKAGSILNAFLLVIWIFIILIGVS